MIPRSGRIMNVGINERVKLEVVPPKTFFHSRFTKAEHSEIPTGTLTCWADGVFSTGVPIASKARKKSEG